MCKVSNSTHFIQRKAVPPDRKALWVPHTDVYTTQYGLVIKVELAGMRSENLQIYTEDNHLRICGERPDEDRDGNSSFLVMEISYGHFETLLELPSGYDVSQAQASYLNGFLKIEVPASTVSSSKRTRIQIAGK